MSKKTSLLFVAFISIGVSIGSLASDEHDGCKGELCEVDVTEYERVAADLNSTQEMYDKAIENIYKSHYKSARCHIKNANILHAGSALEKIISMNPADMKAHSARLAIAIAYFYENPRSETPSQLKLFDEDWQYLNTGKGGCLKATYLAGASGVDLKQKKYETCMFNDSVAISKLSTNLDMIAKVLE